MAAATFAIALGAAACGNAGRPAFDDEVPAKLARRPVKTELTLRADQKLLSSSDRKAPQRPVVPGSDSVAVGKLRGITIDIDGSVLLVDNEYKQVLRADSAGRVRKLIAGGYGSAPGQFIRPIDVAIAPDRKLYVLDADIRSVSVFDSLGKFQRRMPLTAEDRDPFDIVIRDTVMFVLQDLNPKRAATAATMYSVRGTHIGSAFPIGAREREFALGYTGALGVTPGGSVLFGHTQPGTWSTLDSAGAVTRLGSEALPNSRTVLEVIGKRLSQIHSPGGTIAIGSVGRGRVAVLYATQFMEPVPGQKERSLRLSYYVDLFSEAGDYLATAPLQRGFFITAAAFSPRDGRLIVAVSEPYREVISFALDERPMTASR